MRTQKLENLISPYLNLPLECDGFTKVIHYILKNEGVAHKVRTGWLPNSIPHYWIVLDDGRVIDYKLRMWLGSSDFIPHGIFLPDNYPKVSEIYDNYISLPDFYVSETMYKILTRHWQNS